MTSRQTSLVPSQKLTYFFPCKNHRQISKRKNRMVCRPETYTYPVVHERSHRTEEKFVCFMTLPWNVMQPRGCQLEIGIAVQCFSYLEVFHVASIDWVLLGSFVSTHPNAILNKYRTSSFFFCLFVPEVNFVGPVRSVCLLLFGVKRSNIEMFWVFFFF